MLYRIPGRVIINHSCYHTVVSECVVTYLEMADFALNWNSGEGKSREQLVK